MNRQAHPSRLAARRWQLIGLMLWRGGLAFVAAYGFYYGAWQFIQRLDWPRAITIGASIALAGFALLVLSLILDRRNAARTEGDLLRDEVIGGDG